MVTPNRKYLMQSKANPAKWEALEILANDPSNFYRTELDTAGAEKYQKEGGFSIIDNQKYNAELSAAADAKRKAGEPPPPPTGSRLSATAVARMNARAGRESTGPSLMAESLNDSAALAGRSMRERPLLKGLSPEALASAERDVESFQQGLRLKAEPSPLAGRARAPTISVGKPGASGNLRAVEALRAPSREADGEAVASRTAAPETPSTTRRTGDDEFAAAQDEGRERALSVALSRAGARASEAISGVRGDGEAYDALARESGNPARDLIARREADKRKALEDPASEQSQRLRAYVAKALPGVYSDEELASLTAADADAVTRYGEMRQRLDQRAADREAQQTQRTDDIAREDRVREDEQTFRAAEAQKDRALQRELARSRGGGGGARAAAMQAGLERDVQKAGEDLEGAGTLAGDLQYLDQQAAKDDIPGVGRWDSKKTGLLSVLASDDDTRTMQTMRSVVGRLLKERSGTAASDAEVERVMGELGMGPGATEQEFRVGLQRLRQDVGSALKTKQARYRPEVIQTYQERGGLTARDIAPGGAPAAQRSVVDRIKMPDGKTVTLYSDGSEEVS